jgi:ABC-2 type transport system ATP-binding protein
MTDAIQLEGVTKVFGRKVAVRDLTLRVPRGALYGFIGPNGAGKTTSIRMIMSILLPDSGSVTVLGHKSALEAKDRTGYLPEERGLYRKMQVGAFLRFMGGLKGLTGSNLQRRIDLWLDRVDLADVQHKKCEELSKGMQQKLQFVVAVLHEPELLILDEPFSGLDPINAELLREIILELKEDDRTILFASHRMEQVEQLCDDICLISEGQILVNGPLREIKRSFGRDAIVLEFEGDDAFLDEMEAEGLVHVTQRSRQRAELRLLDGTPARRVLETALAHVDDVYRFQRTEPPLNEIFIRVVTEQQGRDVAERAVLNAA